MVAKTNNTINNFNATHSHLETIKHRLVDLLGDDYTILDEPEEFEFEGETFIRYPNRCIYYTHNYKHYDENPSGWIAVSQKDGHLIAGCWACDRPQIIKRPDGYQPAPTLLTLSRNDPRLLKVLVEFGCKEVTKVNERDQIAVAFPVVYADGSDADGSEGFHYRVALEGKNKWLHKEGGKAGEAVFGLHTPKTQKGIQEVGYVVITESPLDAAVLIEAGFPAIAVLGKGNADALACERHRQTLLDLLGDDGLIYVWREPDAAEFAQEVANALQRPVKVIYPPDYAKDAGRIWLACGKDWDRFKAEIVGLIQKTTDVAPQPEPVFEPKTNGRKVEIPETIFKRIGDIKVQEVEWLVDEYIPIGAVTLLAGEGGAGKSTLLCDLTAAILKGDKWLSKFEVSQGGVVLILTEGAIEIRSRLEGYEITDDSPLEIVDLTAWENYTPLKAAQALPQILQIAKERLKVRFGDIPIRLVGLDCLRGFGFDEKQASRQKGDRLPTVREIYNPLAEFAEMEGSAVIVTHHFRKLQPDERRRLFPKRKKGKEVAPDIDINLLRNLIAGTADIVNAARHALVVVGYIEAGVGIIVPVKSNRSQVLGLPIRYDWQTDAPTFLCFMEEDETVMEKATAFLRRVLANGALPSDKVKAQAEAEGISKRTLWRAKSRLGVRSAKQVNGDEVVWIWFLPDRPDPQGSPNGNGSVPNTADNPKLGTVGTLAQKAKQNLAFSTVPNEKGFGTVGTVGRDPADNEVCQVCQTQNPLAQTLAHLKSPINKGISDQVCQVCQTSDNVEVGSPTEAPTRPDQPEGDPQAAPPDLFADFFDAGLLPDLIVEGNPPDSPTLEPVGNQPCAQAQSEVSPPDSTTLKSEGSLPTEPESVAESRPKAKDLLDRFTAEVITEAKCPACETDLAPESNGKAACLGCGRLYFVIPQQQKPAISAVTRDQSQPFTTLNEPICPVCGERLEPDPESGLATCAGCGRLFKVEIPPTNPDDDGDDDNGQGGGQSGFAPPEAPAKEPEGSPPKLTNNISNKDNNGRRVTGVIGQTAKETVSDPQSDKGWVKLPSKQAQSEVGFHSVKYNSPDSRMTERLPNGSIKLVWQDKKKTKTEIVAPDDLADWQPIEEIPEISLPNIESVEIPPTIVLDLETTDKDPAKGRILAAGLALYDKGKEVETLIIANKGNEADLLAQTFDYLRETCNKLGDFILTGYNIFDFDLTFLIERARKLRVSCPFRFVFDENGKIKRWKVAATEGTIKSDPLDYNAILTKDLPIHIVDTLHLVCRWDYTAKQLIHYDLKSVAEHFGVNIPDRPVLSHKEIVHAYYHDRPKFNAYLLADLRETYALFAKLIPPYAGVAALTELPLKLVVVKSTAWIWEKILERYYNEIPQAEPKRDYVGGLVVSRKGLWSPCLKIDIASLYPTLMLAYRIHSRKDPEQIALRWLKTLTRQRLELKAKAKAGDANAQILQEAMKILLNSLYGFYGTGGYPFNDMNAAESVTKTGRKVLTRMIAAIEDLGGIIVEADTDGIIVCYRNADPQQILEAVNAAIPEVFKVEMEWQEATVFVSDNKNYVVLDRNGKIETVKGGKWRGRDKSAFVRKAIPTFLQLWATQGKEVALNYAKQVLSEIRSGQGWDLVVETHRVKEGNTNFINAGFEVGERALFAYKVRRSKQRDSEIAKSPDEGYDSDYYTAKFSETVKDVIKVIDPALIEAWREIVSQEARPLF